MYGKGQLTNTLITKARNTVTTYYSIPGQLSEQESGEHVRWLLSKGIFWYGGIDLMVRFYLIFVIR